MVTNSLRFVSWKDYKTVTKVLKEIYQTITEENALMNLETFEKEWASQCPKIAESWRNNWGNIRSIFSYPEEIRRAVYTTNAIESLNSVIRHATKKRKIFSTDESAKKVIYLTVESASQKWTMSIRNWRLPVG